MKDYGKQRSTVEPKSLDITETKVFVATDIHQVTVQMEEQQVQEYEFNLVEYDKDEYIKLIDEENKSLNLQMTQAQEAMCEIYEIMM